MWWFSKRWTWTAKKVFYLNTKTMKHSTVGKDNDNNFCNSCFYWTKIAARKCISSEVVLPHGFCSIVRYTQRSYAKQSLFIYGGLFCCLRFSWPNTFGDNLLSEILYMKSFHWQKFRSMFASWLRRSCVCLYSWLPTHALQQCSRDQLSLVCVPLRYGHRLWHSWPPAPVDMQE